MVRTVHQGTVPRRIAELLDGALDDLGNQSGVRHAILGVEPGDRSYRWIGATAPVDQAGTPMTPETPYCLASVTKLYIGAAVLRLHEQRRLSIDDRLTDHLSARLVSGLHRRQGVDRSDRRTLRHLLGHASGLPEYLSEAPKGKKALLNQIVEDGDRGWEASEVLDMARAANGAHFDPRPFDGRRHTVRYSDTNFQLLIAVIEAVTGQPIHEAFRTLLYEPLGLTRTWHPGTPPEAEMPSPALLWAGDEPLNRPLALRSFRDLFSTADETLRFLRALITGEVYDSRETAGLMWEHFNPLAFSLIPTSPGRPIEYGIAMMRFQAPRFLKPFIRIPKMIGHTGASGSWLFYAPDSDLYITGTVDQLTAPEVPFRKIPQLVRRISATVRGDTATK